jgi:hypothetical protein
VPAKPRANGVTLLLCALSLLFAIRVLGQALQHWVPQPFLPPFDDFQGSSLPYGLLLSSQFAILAAMVWVAWRARIGALAPSRRAGSVLLWAGGIYMAGSLLRIAIGLTVSGAPAWFSTWIPAVFHVVLAAFVLTLSHYHLRGPGPAPGEGRQ